MEEGLSACRLSFTKLTLGTGRTICKCRFCQLTTARPRSTPIPTDCTTVWRLTCGCGLCLDKYTTVKYKKSLLWGIQREAILLLLWLIYWSNGISPNPMALCSYTLHSTSTSTITLPAYSTPLMTWSSPILSLKYAWELTWKIGA
jgi:hypothetical protein